MSKPVIAYFVTEDWYFCSHRLPLALAAKESGYDVTVIARESSHGDTIRAAGLNFIPLGVRRKSANPLVEVALIRELVRIYKQIGPDIVHHVALKPVLYGSIAARIARVPGIVNAMAGLGFLFISTSWLVRVVRPLARLAFRFALNRSNAILILQNPDDVEEFVSRKLVDKSRTRLIRGAGVDLDEFPVKPEPEGAPVVLLTARLLWDKGIGEFVAAARELARRGSPARFVIAGDADDQNPAAVPATTIDEWREEGIVELLGHRTDIAELLAGCHIACLPSYREGLPKSLLEAAAAGRPIVATDVPGCREIVVHGSNGLLVPAKDSAALAAAIGRLIEAAGLRAQMGRAGRDLVRKHFSIDTVVAETLSAYETVRA